MVLVSRTSYLGAAFLGASFGAGAGAWAGGGLLAHPIAIRATAAKERVKIVFFT